MKTVFDNFDTATGWSASTGATIESVNTTGDLIAGDLTASAMFKFSALNCYVTKIYSTPISTTGYDDIVIWVWSRNRRVNKYRTKDDFSYKISFGTSKEFYMPCYEGFHYFIVDCSKVTTIDQIKITSLSADEDYLVISYGVLAVDDIPLDIFLGVKERLDAYITSKYSTTYSIGTVTAVAGATSIVFTTAPSWIDRYAVVKITGVDSLGVTHTEYHTIAERNNLTFTFMGHRDGKTLKYGYVSGTVYLYIPVVYGRRQTEIELPSITIWGIEPEYFPLANLKDTHNDTWKTDDTMMERREGHFMKFPILIDCEARQDELLAVITSVVRRIVGGIYLYCNGRKLDMFFSGGARETEPTEAFQIIPKVQYIVDVVLQEEVYNKVSLVATEPATIVLAVE